MIVAGNDIKLDKSVNNLPRYDFKSANWTNIENDLLRLLYMIIYPLINTLFLGMSTIVKHIYVNGTGRNTRKRNTSRFFNKFLNIIAVKRIA